MGSRVNMQMLAGILVVLAGLFFLASQPNMPTGYASTNTSLETQLGMLNEYLGANTTNSSPLVNETEPDGPEALNSSQNETQQDDVGLSSEPDLNLSSLSFSPAALPIVDTITLNATTLFNSTNDNLTLHFTVSDADGDNVTNVTDWRVDGSSIAFAYFPFESNGSTNVNDYSSFNQSAVNEGASFISGAFGQAARCVSDRISVNASASINRPATSNQITSMAWIRDSSASFDEWPVMRYDGGSGESDWILGLDSGTLRCFFREDGSWRSSGIGGLTDGNWHLVACQYNGSHVLTYVDGVRGTSTATSFSISSTSINLTICDTQGGGGNEYNGDIDEVRVYDRALSTEQLDLLYQNRTDVIASNETKIGDIWQACLTPNDGTADGTTTCSNNLTILGTPEQPSQVDTINLNATSTDNLTTDNLTLHFTVSDVNGDNITNITDWRVESNSIAVLNMPFETGTHDESSVTVDYSTNGNNGSVVNAVFDATGGFDGFGAYDFDGGDYITANGAEVFNEENFSVMMWVNGASQADNRFYSEGNSGSSSTIFGIGTPVGGGSTVRLFFRDDSGSVDLNVDGTATAFDNMWHHIAYTEQGGDYVLYVDGQVDLNGSYSKGTYTLDRTTIGALGRSTYSNAFAGSMDQVQTYNRSLSPEQIALIYQNQTDIIASNETAIGDTWQACVTPNDGTEDGTTTCSNNLTVIEIEDTCGTVSASKTLIANVNSSGMCFTIDTDNVTLDCDGFNITFNTGNTDAASGINATGLNNVTIRDCTILEGGNANDSRGITFQDMSNSTIINNDIQTNGTNASRGMLVSGGSVNTIQSNTIAARGTFSSGLLLTNTLNNTVQANNVTASDTSSYAIETRTNANFTQFTNNRLENPTQWIMSTAPANNTFTNTSFVTSSGSIKSLQFQIAGSQNITKSTLHIGNNFAFVNSTATPELNDSAIITLSDTGVVSPEPIVDFNDNGTFEVCPVNVCTVLSSTSNSIVFNVTRFTNYSLQGNEAPTVNNLTLNATTLFNSTNDNLTLHFTVSDADSDNVTNVTDWRLNGTSFAVINLAFENGSSNDTFAKDYSTLSRNGTGSAVTMDATGGPDGFGAYEFDGSSSFINVSDDGTIVSAPFAIEAVFNAQTFASLNPIAAKWDESTGDRVWALSGDSGSSLRFDTSPTGGFISGNKVTIAGLSTGTWHHVIAQQNATHNMIILDGVKSTIALSSSGLHVDSNPIFVGHSPRIGGSPNYFDGHIAYFRMYNRSLSDEQAQALFENATDIIASQETAINDTWQACVTPNDGGQDGSETCSNNLTVLAPSTDACGTVSASKTLIEDVNSTGTCYTIDTDNVTLDCDGFTITGTGTGNGIAAVDRTNITIRDCTVRDYSININFTNTNSSRIIDSTALNSSDAVEGSTLLKDSNRNNITGLFSSAITGNGLKLDGSTNNRIINSTANSTNSVALFFTNNAGMNTFQGLTSTSQLNRCINMLSGGSNTFTHTLCTSISSFGLSLSSSNNNFTNTTTQGTLGMQFSGGDDNRFNTIVITGTSNQGLQMLGASNNNYFTNATITANSSNGLLRITGSDNNEFHNSTLNNINQVWIFTDATADNNNLTNITFNQTQGSITILPTATIPSDTNVNASALNISQNNAFLNSSQFNFLNKSAIIKLNNITFVDPAPTRDTNDNGTFEACPANVCTELSFSNNLFRYNTTRFTSYSSQENATTFADCFTTDFNATLGGNLVITQDQTLDHNLVCTAITITNSSTLFVANGTNETNYNITATNLTVETGSGITATGFGFPGIIDAQGDGPGGGGLGPGNNGGGGGAYGGIGGDSGGSGGKPYGQSLLPISRGSAGGDSSKSVGSPGDGGGTIIIQSHNTFTLNGNLTADGTAGTCQAGGSCTFGIRCCGGGGSGGSIFVNTTTFSGTGKIRAAGGNGGDAVPGSDGGGGSGGRAIVYFNTSNYTGSSNINISGGSGHDNAENGDPGTLAFFDVDDNSLTLVNGWEFQTDANLTNITIDNAFIRLNASVVVSTENWILQGGANISCYGSDYDFTLNVSGNVNLSNTRIVNAGLVDDDCDTALITGSMSSLPRINMLETELNGNLSFDLPAIQNFDFINIVAGNDIVFGFNNTLNITHSTIKQTNNRRMISFSADVQNVTLINTTMLGNVNWTITTLSIDENSSINATGLGFAGVDGANGSGPGGGEIGSNEGGGGGHGGEGGTADLASGGKTYGQSGFASTFGSAGGDNAQGAGSPVDGGGLINLQTTLLILNGSLIADGEDGNCQQGGSCPFGVFCCTGAGAGGSIFINTTTLLGNGTLQARGGAGGNATPGNDGGGGGGGRIAVLTNTSTFTPITQASVAGGTGHDNAEAGDLGTLGFIDVSKNNLEVAQGWEFQQNDTFANVTANPALIRINTTSTLTVQNWISIGQSNITCTSAGTDWTVIASTLNFSDSLLQSAGHDGVDCTSLILNATTLHMNDADISTTTHNTTTDTANIQNTNITATTILLSYQTDMNLSGSNFTNDVIIERRNDTAGRVTFTGGVNRTEVPNIVYATSINVTPNLISVDSANNLALNTSARIVLFNTSQFGTLIFRNNEVCPPGICTAIQIADTYIFNVTQFTTYFIGGNVNISADKPDAPDPVNASSLLNYTITLNVIAGPAINVTVVDTYPAEVTFINASPTPDVGTNNTFSLGNLSTGTTTINISVNVTGVTVNGTTINNTAKITFQNITGSSFNFSISENTTVLVPGLSCPVDISTSTTLPQNLSGGGSCVNIVADDVELDCDGHTILYNADGSDNSYGINITSRNNVTVRNCIITDINASGLRGYGININSSNNTDLINNTIQTNGTSDNDGIFITTSMNNTITNNTIRTQGAQSYGVRIGVNSNNSQFHNMILNDTVEWIFTETLTTNFTNTTFATPSGRINLIPTVMNTAEVNITRTKLNISQNTAFLNSTNLSAFNQSAQITLHNLGGGARFPLVDLDDDGIFEPCQQPQCTPISFVGGTFIFNVTGWTTYSTTIGGINLTLTKTDNPDPVVAGAQLNYTITVNVTNGTAFNLSLQDGLPSEVQFVNASPAPDSGTNNTWTAGNLTVGTTFEINLTVQVLANTTSGTINNTLRAAYQNSTGSSLVTQVNELTTVQNLAQPNITLTKTASPDPVTEGSVLTYTITLNNTGNGTAFNTSLTDTIPNGTIFINASPAADSDNNTWLLGNLTSANSTQVTIAVQVNTTGTLNNTANITYANSTGGLLTANTTATTTANAAPTPSQGAETFGGGGGGGGSAGIGQSYSMGGESANQLLRKGDVLHFRYNTEPHRLFVNNILGDLVVVTVQSTPRRYTLERNSPIQIDITGDAYPDILLMLQYVYQGQAMIHIEKLPLQTAQNAFTHYPVIPAESTPSKEEPEPALVSETTHEPATNNSQKTSPQNAIRSEQSVLQSISWASPHLLIIIAAVIAFGFIISGLVNRVGRK